MRAAFGLGGVLQHVLLHAIVSHVGCHAATRNCEPCLGCHAATHAATIAATAANHVKENTGNEGGAYVR